MNERPVTARPGTKNGYDMPLLVTVIILIIFGLIMLFSASWDFSLVAYQSPTKMFNTQVRNLVIGLAAAGFVAIYDYRKWNLLALPMLAITILMLIGVLFTEALFGAARSFFNGSVQPSELAKLVSIIYLSVWLYAKRQFLQDISFGLIPLGVILGIICGLIGIQPDFSAAATVLIMGGLLFFLAGGDLKQIGTILLIAIISALMIYAFSTTGRTRVADFIAGLKDPLEASYHVRRSFEAIINGGLFGRGLGESQSKFTGLPVAPTDSIFAVIAEELGLVGAAGLIGLYIMLGWRGLVVARRAPDMFGTLLASGLVIWIVMEAMINIAVMVGLLPFAGNALPFISSGGSNLVVSLVAVGIILNISRQSGDEMISDEEWRSYSAVANLRWWDGRRGLSRTRRSQRAGRPTTPRA